MATSSYDAGRMDASEYDVTGGGWITFAAILLGLAGTFNVLEGILAIANSRVYTAHQTFVFSNLVIGLSAAPFGFLVAKAQPKNPIG